MTAVFSDTACRNRPGSMEGLADYVPMVTVSVRISEREFRSSVVDLTCGSLSSSRLTSARPWQSYVKVVDPEE